MDQEAGTAFLYSTVESEKTVSAPLGRGLSSTTTKVVTDQKFWLAKAEPEDEYLFVKEQAQGYEYEEWGAAADPDQVLEPHAATSLGTFQNPLFAESDMDAVSINYGRPLSTASDGDYLAMRPSLLSRPSLRHRGPGLPRAPVSGSQQERTFAAGFGSYLRGQ